MRRSNGNTTGHVEIHTTDGVQYGLLYVSRRHKKGLGRLPAGPTVLLDLALRAAPDLTVDELRSLIHADKSIRS